MRVLHLSCFALSSGRLEGVDSVPEKRLIVVDDEADFCSYVASVAEDLGFQVTKVTDPLLFKEAYGEVAPTVVILDMVMPDLDGFELMNWLIEQRSDAKVLLVTGHNPLYAKSAQLLSLAQGLSKVKTFTKPISATKLRSALRQSPGVRRGF